MTHCWISALKDLEVCSFMLRILTGKNIDPIHSVFIVVEVHCMVAAQNDSAFMLLSLKEIQILKSSTLKCVKLHMVMAKPHWTLYSIVAPLWLGWCERVRGAWAGWYVGSLRSSWPRGWWKPAARRPDTIQSVLRPAEGNPPTAMSMCSYAAEIKWVITAQNTNRKKTKMLS